MIRTENIETWGFEHAIRGMRNPLNSWVMSDSCTGASTIYRDNEPFITVQKFVIGPNDLDLMKRLVKAGQPHRKYLRQIFISMDITAPLYWWKEFDTYKVGTVANSCSTMHKIHEKEFTLEDFSTDHLISDSIELLETIIECLNECRNAYADYEKNKSELNTEIQNKKDVWWQMIQLLPSSYNQKRTVTMNYENALNIIEYRANHKLDEWCSFVEILKTLPYIEELIE